MFAFEINENCLKLRGKCILWPCASSEFVLNCPISLALSSGSCLVKSLVFFNGNSCI